MNCWKRIYPISDIRCFVPDVFEVLADPTRRRLIQAMRRGERTVGELVDEVDIHQPGVSKQLRILHEAGFVQVRQEAQRRYYTLRPEPFHELSAWMDDYRQVWDARFDKLADLLKKNNRK